MNAYINAVKNNPDLFGRNVDKFNHKYTVKKAILVRYFEYLFLVYPHVRAHRFSTYQQIQRGVTYY